MTNIGHDTIQKAISVECKHPKAKGIKTTPLKWGETGAQLQNYMTDLIKKDQDTDLYGIISFWHEAHL